MRRALLCACSEQADEAFAPLKYPLSDADAIKRLLDEPDLCAFDEVQVLKNAGKAEVHEALEQLTAESSPEDLVLFYFSGHGKLAKDGSVALVMADTKERRLFATGLLDDQLRVLFNASPARQRVIILDCCYSGAVGEEGFKRGSGDAVEAMAQQIKGTFVLSASTKFQPAMECTTTEASVFTACLIEGVRNGAAAEKGTGCVTLSKLGEYLSREVPLRGNQQPRFWDFGGVGGATFAQAPKQFDEKWTEQTLKRLRQMMARDQIDDLLFVELQQVLRGGSAGADPERLQLIDDLTQRRLKPLVFLRQWQRHGLGQDGGRPEVGKDTETGTHLEVIAPEPEEEIEPEPEEAIAPEPEGEIEPEPGEGTDISETVPDIEVFEENRDDSDTGIVFEDESGWKGDADESPPAQLLGRARLGFGIASIACIVLILLNGGTYNSEFLMLLTLVVLAGAQVCLVATITKLVARVVVAICALFAFLVVAGNLDYDDSAGVTVTALMLSVFGLALLGVEARNRLGHL